MKKGELDLVKEIRKKFSFPENLGIGIGDDAAVLFKTSDSVLLTTDLMIEGVHFDLSYCSPYHVGFKVVTVNVSDIFAMGGTFRGFLLSVGFPVKFSDKDFTDFFEGVKSALDYYDGYLLGGDISKSENFVISGFAIGECEKPILRKGAEPGDLIYITSFTGLSAAGLNVLKSLNEQEREKVRACRNPGNFFLFNSKFDATINELLERHLMPKARDSSNLRSIAKAMMDISDGILIDLYRLCEENNVGAEIYMENIPIHPAVLKVAEHFNLDPMKLILSGGEDYELLVISGKKDIKNFDLILIGRITEQKGLFLIDSQKGKVPLKPEGWQHF